jgi:hypothetical protein
MTSRGAVRMGLGTSPGGGTSRGETTRSLTLRGSGGAIIRPPLSAHCWWQGGRHHHHCPASSNGAFFAVPPNATIPQANTAEDNEDDCACAENARNERGVGRMHAGTADVDRRMRQQRRNNLIADVMGERRHNNLTTAVGPLSGVGRTTSTLPPAGSGRVFFAVLPTATLWKRAANAACMQQRAAEWRRSNNVQWQRRRWRCKEQQLTATSC